MTNYLTRFQAIVAEIKSHPLLEIVEFTVNPPAKEAIFSEIEEYLQAPLEQSIKSFYRECNGIKLHWKIKSGLSDEELDHISEQYDDYDIGNPDAELEESPFAKVNIIPIEDCIFNYDWRGIIIFDEPAIAESDFEFINTTYKRGEFSQCLKPFDLWSSYACMAFLLEKGVGNPKVMMLSDYYIEWDMTRITDFHSYLEMLLVTRCITQSRKRIYSDYRGDKKTILITDQNYGNIDYTPKLFKLS